MATKEVAESLRRVADLPGLPYPLLLPGNAFPQSEALMRRDQDVLATQLWICCVLRSAIFQREFMPLSLVLDVFHATSSIACASTMVLFAGTP